MQTLGHQRVLLMGFPEHHPIAAQHDGHWAEEGGGDAESHIGGTGGPLHGAQGIAPVEGG